MGLLNKFRKAGKKKGIESEVVDNLATIFNMKQGYGAWQEGLGLQGYSNINSSTGAIKHIIADIESTVSQFEKRVQLMDVKLIKTDSPLQLKFQIQCKIGEKFHSFYVGFTDYPKPVSIEEEDDG